MEKREFRENLEWDDRDLVLAKSVMVGVFRSLWIVLLETNQGALMMWTGISAMIEAFADPHTSMACRFENCVPRTLP